MAPAAPKQRDGFLHAGPCRQKALCNMSSVSVATETGRLMRLPQRPIVTGIPRPPYFGHPAAIISLPPRAVSIWKRWNFPAQLLTHPSSANPPAPREIHSHLHGPLTNVE